MTVSCGVEGGDRCYTVTHPGVVKKNCVERFHQPEATGEIAVAIVDLRNSAFHVFSFHLNNTDPVDTIPMHALRCW